MPPKQPGARWKHGLWRRTTKGGFMKTRVLLVTATFVGLAACSNSTDAKVVDTIVPTTEVPTTTTRPATTTTPPPPSPDALYVAAVDAADLRSTPGAYAYSETRRRTDEELVTNAHSVCETAAIGLPAQPENGFAGRTTAQYLVENEQVADGTPNGERVKLAIEHICPELMPVLEAALSGDYETAPALATFGDGTYTVGKEIEPGTYQTGRVSGCYWERLDEAGEIIDNNFVNAAPQVQAQIRASDFAFNTDGCGTWQKIG